MWCENRLSEKFTYVKVDWHTWQEKEAYGFITGGSIEKDATAELKETASFSFEGYEIPDINDLFRVYYSFKNNLGETARVPLATLFVSFSSLTQVDTTGGTKASGSLNGGSVLTLLKDKLTGFPLTIKKNSNAVYEAERLILEVGLRTNAEPSSYNLSVDHTFTAGTSYLEIVNWLLTQAGFAEAFPDPNGIVQLANLSTIGSIETEITFRNDEKSIVLPEVVEDNDWQNSPNVVRLFYNTETVCATAESRNVRGGKSSLDSRGGREISYFEEISELEAGSILEQIKALAESKLREQSADIEVVTFSHAYIPNNLFRAVRLLYSDKAWSGNVENMSISLSPSAQTQLKIKRVLSEQIEVETIAEMVRGQI